MNIEIVRISFFIVGGLRNSKLILFPEGWFFVGNLSILFFTAETRRRGGVFPCVSAPLRLLNYKAHDVYNL